MSEDQNKEILHCKHFVVRKKRFCRMTVKAGQEYCGEHIVPSKDLSSLSSGSLFRITCPLDPKHTCYANNLTKHLKICNARQKEALPYIQKSINVNDDPPDLTNISNQQTRSLANVPVQQIKDVISKVNKIYTDFIENKIGTKQGKHPMVEEELLKPEYGDKSKKHLIQASSLVGLLKCYNLMYPDTCYVEFGAGKGHLSFWVSKSVENLDKSSVLLIERAAHRHKADNKLDKSDGRVHRIRADIADVVLDKIDAVQNSKKVVGITKHLCGEATDLALRCLTNCGDKATGAIFAFCCHHRCQWPSYTGKQFFESVNLCRDDFDVMCGMVSWATCGSGVGREARTDQSDEEVRKKLKLNSRDQELGLNREEKAIIGKRCKHILNWGRKIFLEGLKFQCELNYYISEDISPENLCIIAFK